MSWATTFSLQGRIIDGGNSYSNKVENIIRKVNKINVLVYMIWMSEVNDMKSLCLFKTFVLLFWWAFYNANDVIKLYQSELQNLIPLSPAIIQTSAHQQWEQPFQNRQRCLEDFCIFWDTSSTLVSSAIYLRSELLCNRWVLESDFRETGLWPWRTQVYPCPTLEGQTLLQVF